MGNRTHYELLGLDVNADAQAVRAAFRREVARYHPDKVAHLGPEFQDLAASRTAELNAAYQTLIDGARRRLYDAALARRSAPTSRFESERADGVDIVQRAIVSRVRSAVADVYGGTASHVVRGFDLVLVPVGQPALRSPLPRVFVRTRAAIDRASLSAAVADAVRAGLHVPRSPLNLLAFAEAVEDEERVRDACDQLRLRCTGVPAKTFVVVIDASDWRFVLPSDAPPGLQRFMNRLRS